jgi:hypothetical protein
VQRWRRAGSRVTTSMASTPVALGVAIGPIASMPRAKSPSGSPRVFERPIPERSTETSDLGPGAGHDGERIVFEGTPADLVNLLACAAPPD